MARLLADENVPGHLVEVLRTRGHDVWWARTEARGSADEDLLALAQAQRRILLTQDKDFGVLAFRRRLPAGHGVVLLRLVHLRLTRLVPIVVDALNRGAAQPGKFTVVEEERVRIVPLP
jgi:predicted nuclease of predicted toxin-antitoxin system